MVAYLALAMLPRYQGTLLHSISWRLREVTYYQSLEIHSINSVEGSMASGKVPGLHAVVRMLMLGRGQENLGNE